MVPSPETCGPVPKQVAERHAAWQAAQRTPAVAAIAAARAALPIAPYRCGPDLGFDMGRALTAVHAALPDAPHGRGLT